MTSASEEAYEEGVRLGEELAHKFAEVLSKYLEEEVAPAARRVAQIGGDPVEVLSAIAELMRSAADSIDPSTDTASG
jgi:hypothetical protein